MKNETILKLRQHFSVVSVDHIRVCVVRCFYYIQILSSLLIAYWLYFSFHFGYEFEFVSFLCHAVLCDLTYTHTANPIWMSLCVYIVGLKYGLHTELVIHTAREASTRMGSTSNSNSFDFESLRLNGLSSIFERCVVVVAAVNPRVETTNKKIGARVSGLSF